MPAAVLEHHARLDPTLLADVTDLVTAVTDHDGVPPLSEHVLLHLRYGGDVPTTHVLARLDGRLAGYAHLDATDLVEGASAELAVHPGQRRHGVGTALVRDLLALSPDGRLRLWAHGEHPAAEQLANRLGFRRARVLWQLRRSLLAPLPTPEFPPGVSLRTFVPGVDEAAFVAVNNRAFTGHPEQGGWTVDDVRKREREPWFDPAGFFLAERSGSNQEIVGFHWTKVHGSDPATAGHGHEPIGEVYVVGVDPSEQGHGMGPALTLTGLRYLRSRGLAQVMLYVDDANPRAIAVYERLGFTRWDRDVSYRKD